MSTLINCQKNINYQFKNPDLLEKAFTHRSYLNENKLIKESNERLEFLGDAILELITSEFLYHEFPQTPEGELTANRAKIVQTKTLASVARKLDLGKHIKMSHGEKASGGQENTSILADLIEAIIGSIYLDSGFEEAKKFIFDNLLINYKILLRNSEVEDWKSHLQELVQAKGGIAPIYNVTEENGPDHNKIFTVEVIFFDKAQEKGTGKSKQEAQQEAAHKALEKLTKER